MRQENKQYVDKYFLRTKEILEKEGLNPFVRAQIFVRKGPGIVAGIDEAIKFISENSDLAKNGGAIYSLKDGDYFSPVETQMLIEARVNDIVELETQYLGIITANETKLNDGHGVDLDKVKAKMSRVVSLASGKPVTYFGARHWHYLEDEAIAKAAIEAGAVGASTDAGAKANGTLGVGTIPHALENIFAWTNGKDNAVLEATKAFDKNMDQKIPRIALIDYNNQEISDSLSLFNTIKNMLGVRVDTCGENVAQGALSTYDKKGFSELFGRELEIPKEDLKYWTGSGVTVSGVYSLRKAMIENGFGEKQIILTSGFGSPEKVRAFVRAEELLEMKLFDGLGVGGVYDSRTSTMDIVAVGETRDSMVPMSKVGRLYRPNSRLELRLGVENKKMQAA